MVLLNNTKSLFRQFGVTGANWLLTQMSKMRNSPKIDGIVSVSCSQIQKEVGSSMKHSCILSTSDQSCGMYHKLIQLPE